MLDTNLQNTEWQELRPDSPFYFFIPQNIDVRAEYQEFWQITDIMAENSVGIVTARDHLAIQWSKDDIKEVVKDFVSLSVEDARQKYGLGKDARDWKVSLAQADIKKTGVDDPRFQPILYRPFDVRHTYYSGQTRGFLCMPRPSIMQHLLNKDNMALVTSRMTKGEQFQHVQATDKIVEVICMSPKTSNNGFVFPLYLYPDPNQLLHTSEWPAGKDGRTPNLNPKFVQEMAGKLGLTFLPDGRGDLQATFGAEDVFAYAYAIFHSPTYRERYAEFLKIDFPRLPLTSDRALFAALVAKGHALVDLHLMGDPGKPITTFPQKGSGEVGTIRYVAPTADHAGRVYLNDAQYVEGIAPEVWNFHIGGYQVLEKWLKDRKGRALSFEDVMHYQRIVVALSETIRLMAEIDALIPAFPLG